jgi:Cu/Ag efflux protein CusF
MAMSAFRITTSRKLLSGASLAALLLFGVSASAHHISAASHWAQQSTQANEVSGKVVSIAPDKKSISLEVTDNNKTSTMQFAIDDNTRVTGRVTIGTMADIQYQNSDDGKLLALNISPKTQTQ